jgi:hypothetical protein
MQPASSSVACSVVLFFSCGSRTHLGLRPPHCWGSRSHTDTHTQSSRLVRTSNHIIAEAATCATHNKQNRRTSLPSAEFELAIPAVKQLQTYALNYTRYLNYEPKRSHISRVHNVASAVWLKYVVRIMLFPMINVLYFYASTFIIIIIIIIIIELVRFCTVLYYTYCPLLYCTVLYCTEVYCTVLCFTVPYCTVLHCTLLYSTLR